MGFEKFGSSDWRDHEQQIRTAEELAFAHFQEHNEKAIRRPTVQEMSAWLSVWRTLPRPLDLQIDEMRPHEEEILFTYDSYDTHDQDDTGETKFHLLQDGNEIPDGKLPRGHNTFLLVGSAAEGVDISPMSIYEYEQGHKPAIFTLQKLVDNPISLYDFEAKTNMPYIPVYRDVKVYTDHATPEATLASLKEMFDNPEAD